jgi:hypothetical protein
VPASRGEYLYREYTKLCGPRTRKEVLEVSLRRGTVEPDNTGLGYTGIHTILSLYRRTQHNWAGIICSRIYIPEFSLYRIFFLSRPYKFLVYGINQILLCQFRIFLHRSPFPIEQTEALSFLFTIMHYSLNGSFPTPPMLIAISTRPYSSWYHLNNA